MERASQSDAWMICALGVLSYTMTIGSSECFGGTAFPSRCPLTGGRPSPAPGTQPGTSRPGRLTLSPRRDRCSCSLHSSTHEERQLAHRERMSSTDSPLQKVSTAARYAPAKPPPCNPVPQRRSRRVARQCRVRRRSHSALQPRCRGRSSWRRLDRERWTPTPRARRDRRVRRLGST